MRRRVRCGALCATWQSPWWQSLAMALIVELPVHRNIGARASQGRAAHRLPEVRPACSCCRRRRARSRSGSRRWASASSGSSSRAVHSCSKALNVGAVDVGHRRRGAADLRAGRGCEVPLHRLRPAGARAEAILVPRIRRSGRWPSSRARRSRSTRAQRALPAGQAAGEARAQVQRHPPVYLAPADGRAAFESGTSTPGRSGIRSRPRPRRPPARACWPMVRGAW